MLTNKIAQNAQRQTMLMIVAVIEVFRKMTAEEYDLQIAKLRHAAEWGDVSALKDIKVPVRL